MGLRPLQLVAGQAAAIFSGGCKQRCPHGGSVVSQPPPGQARPLAGHNPGIPAPSSLQGTGLWDGYISVTMCLRISRLEEGTFKQTQRGASLVAQWLRICLPMQGTRVRALVWEDPTCRGATKPVCRNH